MCMHPAAAQALLGAGTHLFIILVTETPAHLAARRRPHAEASAWQSAATSAPAARPLAEERMHPAAAQALLGAGEHCLTLLHA